MHSCLPVCTRCFAMLYCGNIPLLEQYIHCGPQDDSANSSPIVNCIASGIPPPPEFRSTSVDSLSPYLSSDSHDAPRRACLAVFKPNILSSSQTKPTYLFSWMMTF